MADRDWSIRMTPRAYGSRDVGDVRDRREPAYPAGRNPPGRIMLAVWESDMTVRGLEPEDVDSIARTALDTDTSEVRWGHDVASLFRKLTGSGQARSLPGVDPSSWEVPATRHPRISGPATEKRESATMNRDDNDRATNMLRVVGGCVVIHLRSIMLQEWLSFSLNRGPGSYAESEVGDHQVPAAFPLPPKPHVVGVEVAKVDPRPCRLAEPGVEGLHHLPVFG